jgi:polar amino acid transport system permease protein
VAFQSEGEDDLMADQISALFTLGNMQFLLRGAGMTLLLTAIGCTAGLIGGFLLAYARGSKGTLAAPLRWGAISFVEVFRRIPFLVTLFLVLYTAQMIVPRAPLFWVAVVSICLLCSAYMAEIVRSGMESVPAPQIEAAEVMNFSRWRITWMIVLPQAWKVILPSAVSYMVMFVKDTALASQAGVFELMFAGKALANRGLDPFLVFATVLFAYFAISWPLARFGRWLEARLARRTHEGGRR